MMVTSQRHSEAMEKINVLVGVRERSVKEVRERLASCDFTHEEVEDAIETAVRVNLINEERYTRAFIRGKTHSGWGRVRFSRVSRPMASTSRPSPFVATSSLRPETNIKSPWLNFPSARPIPRIPTQPTCDVLSAGAFPTSFRIVSCATIFPHKLTYLHQEARRFCHQSVQILH